MMPTHELLKATSGREGIWCNNSLMSYRSDSLRDSDEGGADLHIHSHYSDGSYSPTEIVNRASAVNLNTIALTDHDTVEGIDELFKAAESRDLNVIPGVEISCEIEDKRYHVLGYYIDWTMTSFVDRLKYFERARADRIRRMVDVLDKENIDISFDEIQSLAGKSLIGKPHVAQALVNHGVVGSFREAFDRFLGDDQILDNVSKERMSLQEAIDQIKNAGGIPVLAHPIHYEDDLDLENFSELGVQGLEVYYSDHSQDDINSYKSIAEEFGLLISGGSDFHGEVKPEIELGDFRMDTCYVDKLHEFINNEGSP